MLSNPCDFPELLAVAESERAAVLKHCRRLVWQQLIQSTYTVYPVIFIGAAMIIGLLLNAFWLFTLVSVAMAAWWWHQQFTQCLHAQLYLEIRVFRATQISSPNKTLGDWLRELSRESLRP